MENMKRVLSGFLALVLVLGMLPGVPMFAAAEEVETLPVAETVEATEAVTVPVETAEVTEVVEETAAPVETLPEETVPETTEAVETVPAETEAEETVPEETVAEETVPEETAAEETVAAEILEEQEATEEAVDGVVLNKVTDIQLKASAETAFIGEKVTITATVTPANADIPDVEFYIVEEESDAIAYDAELLAEKGILVAEEAGKLTVAARATDGDPDEGVLPHDSITQEEGGKVTVTFVEYSMTINRTAKLYDEENVLEYNGDETEVVSLKIMTGKGVGLSVHYRINGEVKPSLQAPNVKWYLAEGDEAYASVTVDEEDCREVTVTGKTVTETKYITLYAKDETVGAVDSIAIAVYPVPYKVGIYDEDGVEVTNETVVFPLLTSEIKAMQEKGKDYLELPMTAQVWPLEAEEPMTWTCSDGMVQVIHPDKEDAEVVEGEEPEKDTTVATLRVYPLEGETTIIITSKNYPNITSQVTIERKWCLEAENLEFHQDTENLSVEKNSKGLLSGQSVQLKVYDVRDPEHPELLTSESVKWSLAEGDDALATISEEGKLTAKKDLTSGGEITVRCAVVGNEESYLELTVLVRPLSTEVRILPGDLAEEGLDAEAVLNDQTIAVDTADGRDPFRLDVLVLPADEEGGASQEVTWKSSNTKIATVDPDTEKIKWEGKNGTVTITATAADGSGKKASVKLNFGAQVREITILQDDGFFLRSGKSWTFDVEFDPVNPTNKGLTWSLVGENDTKYASISATSGKLTAKTVYEEHIVTVRATAKDGSGVYAETQVTIKPKTDGILILKEADEYVTKTTRILSVGDSIELDAYILGMEDKTHEVKWKVSSTSRAELSDTVGGSTTVTLKNTGSVTVTATSLSEPKKTATVTLKGVRMTDYIEWTHTHDITELACGKSLTLKAKSYDAEGKTPTISKLAWSIEQEGNYAKVSNGKVTAIAGALSAYDDPVEITVVAAPTDDSGADPITWDITIYPIVQSVVIDRPTDVYPGTNTFVMENPGLDSVSLTARVFPETAMDTVTWKSSNKKIATVDEYGEVTCLKAGTVTITATAADGSGKKATYKLTILQKPAGVYFDNEHFAIAGGKSLKLKPVLVDGDGNKVTGKKLEWKILPVEGMEDGTPYATSISGGTLRTKKVTGPKQVQVVLRTVEKNEEWEFEYSQIVTIHPAASSVMILDAEGNDIGSSEWAALSAGGIQLDTVVKSTAGDGPYQGVTWKSSNKKIAEIDSTGKVTFLKAGTVTITATTADGTGKKDSFKLTIED